MATGFMAFRKKLRLASLAALAALAPLPAQCADVTVTALFNGRAVLVIDGGKPRTLAAGQVSPEGVKLVAATSESAVIEFAGKQRTLVMGHATRIDAPGASSGAGQVTLIADARGQFFATGSINGMTVRFLVDTGASSIALSTDEARRLGINYLAGTRGLGATAGGTVATYRVKLDNVRVGDITLNNVDAAVLEGSGLKFALLGMSFLNRTGMKREGDTLTLTRRY